jgi:hypothetical protein
VDQIPGFLDAVALRLGTPVLLHTEVMRQHFDALAARWSATERSHCSGRPMPAAPDRTGAMS